MIETIRTKPHRFLFQFSLFFALVGSAIWMYDYNFGYDSNRQGDVEQFFRFIFGSMLLHIPKLLLFALIYWLMHHFNKPTQTKLNLWHIAIVLLGILLSIGSGLISWFDNSSIGYRPSPMRFVSLGLGLISLIIFITNIVLSFKKASSAN